MNPKRLRTILQSVKSERRGGAPHEVWVKKNRDILMMQVRNTMDLSAARTYGNSMRHLFGILFPVETLALAGRAIAVFVLALGTIVGGGLASAQMYRTAEPGHVMYTLKVAVERTQLALAPSVEYRARLLAEFADRRVDEVAKLAETPDRESGHIAAVLASFNNDVTGLQGALEELRKSDPVNVVETAKLMERKMAVYQNVLSKAGASLPSSYADSFAQARDLVDGLTIKAMAVIVEKHLEGSALASKSVLVSKFEDRLSQAEAKVDSASDNSVDAKVAVRAKQAKDAIAEVKRLVKDEQYQAALSKMVDVVELTKEVESKSKVDVTVPAPETVQPASSDAQKVEAPAISPVKTDDAVGSPNR